MTKNNDGRKHWRFGWIYEKEQVQLWNFLRKAWENFGATVLANTSGTTSRNEETRQRKVSISEEGIMASQKASHVEIDPQVAVKLSNAKGQPLPNGLTDLKSRQKTLEEKVQAT